MTTRNYDSSQLTKLRGDRNMAYFYTRQQVASKANSAQGSSAVLQTFNGQTGVWDSSKLAEIAVGKQMDTNRTTNGATVNNYSCACVLQQSYAQVPPNTPVAVTIPSIGPATGQLNFVS